MMGVWQKLVLFLVYAQLLNGVLGHNVWLDILGRVLLVRILSIAS